MKTSSNTTEEAYQENDEDKTKEEENRDEVDLTPGVQDYVTERLDQVIRNEGEGRRIDRLWLNQNQSAQNQHGATQQLKNWILKSGHINLTQTYKDKTVRAT